MGTSSRSSGPNGGTPLVPSFLTEPATVNPSVLPAEVPASVPVVEPQPVSPASPNAPAQGERPPLPPLPPEPKRFSSARTGFTRFAKNREEGSLRRALGNYVTRGAGGRRGATQRMGASRQTAARLAGFVQTAQAAGTAEALRSFGLERCIGRPAGEVLPELLEAICPDGGRIDEGIAREAFQGAIAEFAAQDLPAIEELTPEQWNVLFVDFLVRSIELRVIADIGQRSLEVPENIEQMRDAANVMHNVISATVREALGDTLDRLGSVPAGQLQAVTDQAYERAWGAYEAFAGEEEYETP